MSEQMPERIWACGPSRYAGNWGNDPCFVEEQGAAEYIRADLVREAKRQERERLRARMIEWAKSSTTDGADLAHIFDEEGERDD